MKQRSYSDEQLKIAVADSFSVMEVMRKLNMRMAGGSHYHISQRIEKMGLDTTHFTRQAHNKGKPSPRKFTADDILVVLPEGHFRPKADKLKRALLEKGIKYSCAVCDIHEWNARPISLDVDHVDGDWLNNLIENLRFLCPNCHRQTDTFGSKNNKAR